MLLGGVLPDKAQLSRTSMSARRLTGLHFHTNKQERARCRGRVCFPPSSEKQSGRLAKPVALLVSRLVS